ncbi:hypothetical protein DV738_g749, partial [Chaetothyriales sp. CBS 135597]
MSNPAVQLSFTLRTSPNVRTVHLLGSWDNYKSQLPLSALKDAGAKPGSWKGTFRFQGSHALKLGSRYWYYYIVDGYHVSHDPAKEFITEKTTGRKLNVLDVPGGKGDAKATRPTVNTQGLSSANRHSREIPKGRALSPGKIVHPKPSKPYASRGLREADYDVSPVDELEDRFAATRLSDRHGKYSSSPSELSDDSSSSGTAFSRSSPSSLSSLSDVSCKCDRYGVTRSGQRVKLDCGGKRCGYSGSSSECSSENSDDTDDSEDERRYRARKEAERRRATEVSKSSARGVDDRKRRSAQVIERKPRR